MKRAIPTEKPASLPLTTPDGEVLSYACGLCRRVRVSGESLGPPDADRRALLAEHHKVDAEGCCVCRKCGKMELGVLLYCAECEAKQRAEWRAIEESEEAKTAEQQRTDAARDRLFWARGEHGPTATVTSARYGWEGGKWLAFPGHPEDVDADAFSDDPESYEFWTSGAAEFVGRGDTPDAALADLVRLAQEHKPKGAVV